MKFHDDSNIGKGRLFGGFLRVVTLSLLLAAFGITQLHGQIVAYVTNDGAGTVSVIDTSTNTVTATITVGNNPVGVVFSPDGINAYVTNLNDSTISVVDTTANAVTATITLGSPGNVFPALPAIAPDGKNLYVPDQLGNVFVVSTTTNTVTATIPISGGASAAAVTPDGTRVYALTAFANGAIAVIDTATNTVLTTINGAQSSVAVALGIAETPNGASVYVTGGFASGVSVISTASNTVSATIPLASGSEGIAITPDGSRAYVTNFANPTVQVIDTATNTVEPGAIPVGNNPILPAVTPDGAFVYVTNTSDNTVSVIATATNAVTATIPAGVGPSGIAIANLSSVSAAFTIDSLVINSNLHEQGDFALGANSGGIDLAHQPVTLTVNNFSLTIPPGSFRQVGGNMHFVFNGTVNGLKVNFNIQAEHGSSTQFDFVVDVHGVSIDGPNPANVGLKIGHNIGTTTVTF